MKIRIVNANIGGNIGDRVILYNTVKIIKDINPLAEVSYELHIGDYKLNANNFYSVAKEAIGNPINESVKSKVDKIKESDIVLVIGGGYLYDYRDYEINEAELILHKLLEPMIALNLNKPVVFLGHTVDIRIKEISEVLATILKRDNCYITSREFFTNEYLKQYTGNNTLTGDVAFLTEFNRIENPERNRIGICVRGDKLFPVSLLKQIIMPINDKCEFFSSSYGEDIQYYLETKIDIPIIPEFKDFADVCEYIQHYKYVITNRFHVGVACILTDTPFIPLQGLSHKLNGLIHLLNFYTREEIINMAKENIEVMKGIMKC